jgi:hypothetical protein
MSFLYLLTDVYHSHCVRRQRQVELVMKLTCIWGVLSLGQALIP